VVWCGVDVVARSLAYYSATVPGVV
jgi:hypothetical protein